MRLEDQGLVAKPERTLNVRAVLSTVLCPLPFPSVSSTYRVRPNSTVVKGRRDFSRLSGALPVPATHFRRGVPSLVHSLHRRNERWNSWTFGICPSRIRRRSHGSRDVISVPTGVSTIHFSCYKPFTPTPPKRGNA